MNYKGRLILEWAGLLLFLLGFLVALHLFANVPSAPMPPERTVAAQQQQKSVRLYWGGQSGLYSNVQPAPWISGQAAEVRLTNLPPNKRVYVAAVGRNALGVESEFSRETNGVADSAGELLVGWDWIKVTTNIQRFVVTAWESTNLVDWRVRTNCRSKPIKRHHPRWIRHTEHHHELTNQ